MESAGGVALISSAAVEAVVVVVLSQLTSLPYYSVVFYAYIGLLTEFNVTS